MQLAKNTAKLRQVKCLRMLSLAIRFLQFRHSTLFTTLLELQERSVKNGIDARV